MSLGLLPKIFTHAISFMRDDRTVLACCALVSRSWRVPAQDLLFRRLPIVPRLRKSEGLWVDSALPSRPHTEPLRHRARVCADVSVIHGTASFVKLTASSRAVTLDEPTLHLQDYHGVRHDPLRAWLAEIYRPQLTIGYPQRYACRG
jgi:hypothetical protein